jgi:putative oxidoreductase
MKYILLLGRVLFSSVFFIKGLNHFHPGLVGFKANVSISMSPALVIISGIIVLVGALSILLGIKARWGAWVLVIFLVPVTLIMHRFWEFGDNYTGMMHEYCFWKNMSLIGGALIITYFGSGPLSLSKE